MIKATRKKTYIINYDTQWKHDFLKPQQYLTFKANTPIEEIVPKLENYLNELCPDLNANYKRSLPSFQRLYRNLIYNFKGWQILYRKPNSKKPFEPITEQIGYKPRNKKQLLKQKILKTHMRWTHECYPLIDPVEIKGVDSCATIAQKLNAKTLQPNYKQFLENLEFYFNGLSNSYTMLPKKSVNFKENDQNICQRFFKNLEIIYHYSEPMNRLMTKDYFVRDFNINDVLKQKPNQTTKGWRVEFIDENQ